MGKFIDLTGKRFGRLVVLRLDKERTKSTGRTYWICKCDCGKEISVLASHLQFNRTQSCGCLRGELSSKRLSKSNRIEFDSNLGCLRVYFNNINEYFLCDIEDRDIAEKYCWYKDANGYVAAMTKDSDGNRHGLLFHREVMKKQYGNIYDMLVDHKNHNTLDNRKNINIRLCTHSENLRNGRPTSNTGKKYVSFNKFDNRYIVKIPNKSQKAFMSLFDAFEYIDNYIENHPNDFYYDSNDDYLNRNKYNTVIYPFIFINPEEIIHPFKFY